MRNGFSSALISAAMANQRILLLTGDHGNTLFDDFRHRCPEQYVNAGIAEQNMVGVAAGLAKTGFRPVVYGLSAFVPIRVLEQIKLDLCCDRLPVLLIGDGAGFVYSTLGVSHQSMEDIAALRALPNLHILSPADAHEMKAGMALALNADGPVYLRMGKSDLGNVHAAPVDVNWGELLPLKRGDGPIVFIGTGSMVKLAVDLAAEWPESAVWSAPSIKPLDSESVTNACRGHRFVVTLEEHNIYGGLGSATAEILSERLPLPVCRIGVPDRFSRYCGSWSYLRKEHGLDLAATRAQIEAFIKTHSTR